MLLTNKGASNCLRVLDKLRPNLRIHKDGTQTSVTPRLYIIINALCIYFTQHNKDADTPNC